MYRMASSVFPLRARDGFVPFAWRCFLGFALTGLFALSASRTLALTWRTVNPPLAPNETVVYALQNPAAAPVPGANPNGITDNTSAFQNAINIIHAGGGGVLYVP